MDQFATAPAERAQWDHYVRRCALRDESALAALYDESSRLAFTVALRILQNEADAAEVVVDVYRQVWESASRFDAQRGSAGAWITIIARSRAMDRLRHRRVRQPGELEELRDVISSQPSPETLAITSQRSGWLAQALALLSAEQRQALELAFFRGLSHSEIADGLGLPLGTVKTRIRGAVARLRQGMQDAI